MATGSVWGGGNKNHQSQSEELCVYTPGKDISLEQLLWNLLHLLMIDDSLTARVLEDDWRKPESRTSSWSSLQSSAETSELLLLIDCNCSRDKDQVWSSSWSSFRINKLPEAWCDCSWTCWKLRPSKILNVCGMFGFSEECDDEDVMKVSSPQTSSCSDSELLCLCHQTVSGFSWTLIRLRRCWELRPFWLGGSVRRLLWKVWQKLFFSSSLMFSALHRKVGFHWRSVSFCDRRGSALGSSCWGAVFSFRWSHLLVFQLKHRSNAMNIKDVSQDIEMVVLSSTWSRGWIHWRGQHHKWPQRCDVIRIILLLKHQPTFLLEVLRLF